MLRKLIPTLLFLLLACGVALAQENEQSPYEIALQKIEEARVSGAIELNLSNLGLGELPPEIGNLTNLNNLYLSNNQLSNLPPDIGNLRSLHYLILNNNNLPHLPTEIGNLQNLRELHLSENQLIDLPPDIGNLSRLERLYLDNNNLINLPIEIGYLDNLEVLNLSNNELTNIPSEMGNLGRLCYLSLSNNHLQYIPSSLGQLPTASECYLYTDFYVLFVDGNPLISPSQEVIDQGTGAILDYLRNEAWWHLQRLIAAGAGFVGILAATILGFRWKNRRGKTKRKNMS